MGYFLLSLSGESGTLSKCGGASPHCLVTCRNRLGSSGCISHGRGTRKSVDTLVVESTRLCIGGVLIGD